MRIPNIAHSIKYVCELIFIEISQTFFVQYGKKFDNFLELVIQVKIRAIENEMLFLDFPVALNIKESERVL